MSTIIKVPVKRPSHNLPLTTAVIDKKLDHIIDQYAHGLVSAREADRMLKPIYCQCSVLARADRTRVPVHVR